MSSRPHRTTLIGRPHKSQGTRPRPRQAAKPATTSFHLILLPLLVHGGRNPRGLLRFVGKTLNPSPPPFRDPDRTPAPSVMGRSSDVRFVSSGVKLPSASASAPSPAPAPQLLSAALPFAHIGRAVESAARRLGACLPRVPAARADPAPPQPARRHGKDAGGGGEERVLISEVAVRGKDGEPLERPELEAAAAAALRACRPNAALTVREVQEDVHRVVESGLFRSCMPVAVDTRDGIRLVFEVLVLSSCFSPTFNSFRWLISSTDGCIAPVVLWFRWSRTRTSMGWSARAPTFCRPSSWKMHFVIAMVNVLFSQTAYKLFPCDGVVS